MQRIVDAGTGAELVPEVRAPRPFSVGSARGLLGARGLAAGHGLLLRDPLRAVHTFGMRFAIDVVMLDRSLVVVAVVAGVRPRRIVWHPRGCWQLELAAGGAARAGLHRGRPLAVVRRAQGGSVERESPRAGAPGGEPAHGTANARCARRSCLLLIPHADRQAGDQPLPEGDAQCAQTC